MSAKIVRLFLMVFIFCALPRPVVADSPDKNYQQYINYFEKVYKIFADNYYLAPDRGVYDHFLQKFNSGEIAQSFSIWRTDIHYKISTKLLELFRADFVIV